MRLLEPLVMGSRTARNRVLFGPIVTNLANDDRTFSGGHLAFYRRRAAGGCGTIVFEEASVHASDWPYERAPLAERCGAMWADLARAMHDEGALAFAALGHSGGQGSSAYHQRELWAPSRVPEVATREVPKSMEEEDIAAVIAGFGAAAHLATEAGLDGVEINAGQYSLVRQFMSGLTNQRSDRWTGTAFGRAVVAAVRNSFDGVVSLRLSCDELAPWAGITPDAAEVVVSEFSDIVDLVVVVRGSIFTVQATRPDHHEAPGFNIDLCRAMRVAAGGAVPVVLQGSIVDVAQAEWALTDGVCDAVEMTRAQLADAALVARVTAGHRARPCTRCNQMCQVRDVRNPIISCVVDPATGYEGREPSIVEPFRSAPRAQVVHIVGAGPAGLEAARVAAGRGHQVVVHERTDRVGGLAVVGGPARPFIDWLVAECDRLGVEIRCNEEIEATSESTTADSEWLWCTGSIPGDPTYLVEGPVLDVADALRRLAAGEELVRPVVIWDPIGGPIAVDLAEHLGAGTHLVTGDQIAGNELSRSGDLAPVNSRLAQLGVVIERRSRVVAVGPMVVTIEDRFSGSTRTLPIGTFVDAGFRLPARAGDRRAGDCVAPRTVMEAVLEGRRQAISI